jgi:hypothetical protein
VVSRTPNLIRSLTSMRDNVEANISRIRREDFTFAPSDWTRGEPAISATMANVFVTRVHRSGHALYMDIAAGLGNESVLSAQVTVPDLALIGPAVTSGAGGTEQDLRLQLALPSTWEMGAVHRVYIQAMRVSGVDATTLRILRAWQR